jgi:hypothetical protein
MLILSQYKSYFTPYILNLNYYFLILSLHFNNIPSPTNKFTPEALKITRNTFNLPTKIRSIVLHFKNLTPQSVVNTNKIPSLIPLID